MSIENFTKVIRDQAYRTWLEKLDRNIVLQASETLRAGEQTAPKTSFYVTKNQIRNIYQTITGEELSETDASIFIDNLYVQNQSPGGLNPQRLFLDKDEGIMFKSIGWDTITKLMNPIFKNEDKVKKKYKEIQDTYEESELAKLETTAKYKAAPGNQKQKMRDDVTAEAKRRGTFGYFVNKGHVVSVATNLVIKFRDDIQSTQELNADQKKKLLEVLDQYIAKLVSDDIASANLKGINQSIYANYIKSTYGDGTAQYLAEFQFRLDNQASGSASAPILNEINRVFGLSTEDAEDILKNSTGLGQALLTSPGSPSFIQMIADGLSSIIETGKGKAKSYQTKPTEVAKKSTKISSSKNNFKNILNQLQPVDG